MGYVFKSITTITFIGLLFFSCSTNTYAWRTTKNFETILKTWLNSPSDELVISWGSPQSVYNLSDGGKLITYIMNTGQGSSIVPIGSTYRVINRQWYCKVNFQVNQLNIVTKYSFEGNNCKASKPKVK